MCGCVDLAELLVQHCSNVGIGVSVCVCGCVDLAEMLLQHCSSVGIGVCVDLAEWLLQHCSSHFFSSHLSQQVVVQSLQLTWNTDLACAKVSSN